jgi:hypothetical protein
MMSRRAALALLVAAILVGFALRLYRLNAVAFRGDEAFAAQYWAGEPLTQSLATIAIIEPHPPLNYALFRVWGLIFGISEFTLRMLPAMFNLLGIPALYALGHRLQGRSLGMLAALLWAVNPYQIWQAQDARNYAIWAGLSAIGVWLALRLIDGKPRGIDWLLYFFAAFVTTFIFYFELLTLSTISLYAIVRRRRDRIFLTRWLALQVGVFGCALLSFVVLQGRLFAGGGYGGTVFGFSAPLWLTWFLPTLTFGDTPPNSFVSVLWIVTFIVLVVALAVVWRENSQRGLFLGLLAIAPPAMLGVISLKMNVFHPRYVLSAAPAFLLLFAGLVLWMWDHFPSGALRRTVPLVLLAGWLGVSGFSLYDYFFVPDYVKSQNWAAVTRYLQDHVQSDDLVIQTSVDAAFGYYYHAPATDIGLPANPQETREAIADTLSKSRDDYRSIWAVGRTFSDWQNAGIVEQWLNDNMQRVHNTSAADLPIEQFMRWEVSPDEIGSTPLATFQGVATLMGARIFTPPEPTGELVVWLYWQPIAQTQKPLKVFAHLLGATNPATGTPLWTQDDHFPQNGRISTDHWDAEMLYRDVYTLPATDIPGGEYQVEVGFYDPDTNQRVKVDGGDSFITGTIRLS